MGNRIIPSGQYKGKTVQEVINTNPEYILWMSEHNQDYNLTEEEINSAYFACHVETKPQVMTDYGLDACYGF